MVPHVELADPVVLALSPNQSTVIPGQPHVQLADPTGSVTQSKYSDTRPTCLDTHLFTPIVWHSNHQNVTFYSERKSRRKTDRKQRGKEGRNKENKTNERKKGEKKKEGKEERKNVRKKEKKNRRRPSGDFTVVGNPNRGDTSKSGTTPIHHI